MLLPADILEQVHQFTDAHRVQSCRGLVQNKDFRLHDHNAGKCHPLFLSEAQGVSRTVFQVCDPHLFHDRFHTAVHLLRGQAHVDCSERNVLIYRSRKQLVVRILKDDTHLGTQLPQACFFVGNRLPAKANLSLLRLQNAVEMQKQRRLSGTVCSQNRGSLAFFKCNGQILNGVTAFVIAIGEMTCL